MENDQQNHGAFRYWYGHVCRSGGCLCSQGHPRSRPTQKCPGILPDRSQLVLPWPVQNCKHHKERDDCFTTRGLDSLMISRRTMFTSDTPCLESACRPLGGMTAPAAQGMSIVFWQLHSGPVIGGQANRIPQLTTEAWRAKKIQFGDKTSERGEMPNWVHEPGSQGNTF